MTLGRYALAKQFIEEAVRAFEEMGNVLGLGYALLKRGQLATFLGEYQQAIQFFQHAIANFNEVRTEHNVIWAQIELGTASRLHGDYDQAAALYRRSLDASTAHNQKAHIADCLVGLGCLAYDQGELHRAEQYQREALALYEHLEAEVRAANVLRHLGHVMVASGEHRHDEAREHFRQALELATEHQTAPIALDVCVGVAQLLTHDRDLARAVELLALAEHHEASTFETKQKAHQRLVEFTSQLQPEIAHTAQAQGRTRELWATVAEIVDALAAEETPASASSAAQ